MSSKIFLASSLPAATRPWSVIQISAPAILLRLISSPVSKWLFRRASSDISFTDDHLILRWLTNYWRITTYIIKKWWLKVKVTILKSHLQELAKRCTCNILILIFSLDFDKQCQMCKKKFFKVSQSGIFRRCEKIWLFRVQDREEMTIKFCP